MPRTKTPPDDSPTLFDVPVPVPTPTPAVPSEAEVRELAERVAAADRAYHSDGAPAMDDAAYDAMRRRFDGARAARPDVDLPVDPSTTVGARPPKGRPKVPHREVFFTNSNRVTGPTNPQFGGMM